MNKTGKTYLAMGNTAFNASQFHDAIKYYQKALVENPQLKETISFNIKLAQARAGSVKKEFANKKNITTENVNRQKIADGIWEWSEYKEVKEEIERVKAQKVQITSLKLEKINGDIKEVASQIRLPRKPREPDVSIIIPTFNNIKYTVECLLSISKNTEKNISYEVVIADDASTDGSIEIFEAIENITLLKQSSNVGFILNCNHALENICGKYVVFLNNDLQVTEGWLNPLLMTFKRHINAGIVGPKFLYPSGHLQEAGCVLKVNGSAIMLGLNDDPQKGQYNYERRVDYVSGACLMMPTALARKMKGFSEEFYPCYCEDSDLCMRVEESGYDVIYNPDSTVIHHLSKTTNSTHSKTKIELIQNNSYKLSKKWGQKIAQTCSPKPIAFYLPQFHPCDENDIWWGAGFTEWTNVSKARKNFENHYQPRYPADLGFYDLRLIDVMKSQAELAKRYGIYGFCYYYYWFDGKRLLDLPIEQMLDLGVPQMPFCLCWANENWSRRWDGLDKEILITQSYSTNDDVAVIHDLIRYFKDQRYIKIDGKPLILIYKVTSFPDFQNTSSIWRKICNDVGIGEIYIAMVESTDLVNANQNPSQYGCDAAVEFPPLEMADKKAPNSEIINPEFEGSVGEYKDIAIKFATREFPNYKRFKGVMPGWDNSARMQNRSFCFDNSTPGIFQAWIEETVNQTFQHHFGDERLFFINAWNEWAEGAYLEPDARFGHTYLEAVKNALDANRTKNE